MSLFMHRCNTRHSLIGKRKVRLANQNWLRELHVWNRKMIDYSFDDSSICSVVFFVDSELLAGAIRRRVASDLLRFN